MNEKEKKLIIFGAVSEKFYAATVSVVVDGVTLYQAEKDHQLAANTLYRSVNKANKKIAAAALLFG